MNDNKIVSDDVVEVQRFKNQIQSEKEEKDLLQRELVKIKRETQQAQ